MSPFERIGEKRPIWEHTDYKSPTSLARHDAELFHFRGRIECLGKLAIVLKEFLDLGFVCHVCDCVWGKCEMRQDIRIEWDDGTAAGLEGEYIFISKNANARLSVLIRQCIRLTKQAWRVL